MATQFKRDYDKLEEQNDVTIVGIGNENNLTSNTIDILTNILSNLKFTMFPIVLEFINYCLIGNLGDYEDIISYSISILFINVMGLSFGIGVIDSFDDVDVKNNVELIKENPRTSLYLYYDCTKFYLYLVFLFLAIVSYFSRGLLYMFHFNDLILDEATTIIKISILSNFFILNHFYNLKVLRLSAQIKHCDKVNITSTVLHLVFSFMFVYFMSNKIFALALSILISSFFMFLFSTFFVEEYAAVKPPILGFSISSINSLGWSFFKSATYYGVRNLINYLFFAIFVLLSIHLTEYEFAINSLIGNFMRTFFAVAAAIGLSYKYYHDFSNSNTFIQQYSHIFTYVVGFIILLVGIIFFFLHSFISDVYSSDDTLDSGVDSVVLLYPFFFLLEVLISVFEQETNLRKKKHKKTNYYGLIMNVLAIIIFSPIAGMVAFYWEFSYGGIWICYFEFLVFKFIVYLIINLFKF